MDDHHHRLLHHNRLTESTSSKLYGREVEFQLLRHALSHATTSSKKQLVFVRGASGTGKSRLIASALGNHNKCLYGSGKLEETPSKPFAALLQSFAELCMGASLTKDKSVLQERLRATLDAQEVSFLQQWIPELAFLLVSGSPANNKLAKAPSDLSVVDAHGQRRSQRRSLLPLHNHSNTGDESSSSYSKEHLTQLKYICRCFLQAMCRPEQPVVLVLDDVQWIDETSLDLLQAILADSSLKHLLFVASYRNADFIGHPPPPSPPPPQSEEGTNEEKNNQMEDTNSNNNNENNDDLPEWILTRVCQQQATLIDLDNWDVATIANVLSDLLRKETDQVLDLAELVYDRTHGNIFHTIQLMDYLQAMKMISQSTLDLTWTYDIGRIREQTVVSENLLLVLGANIQRLTRRDQMCLQLCGCLGFRFELPILSTVFQTVLLEQAQHDNHNNHNNGDECKSNDEEDENDVERCLHRLVQAGLVKPLDEVRYKFSHDQIHRAALESIDPSQKETLHFRIGTFIWEQSIQPHYRDDDHGLVAFCDIPDRLLFLCVDQLNIGRKQYFEGAMESSRVDLPLKLPLLLQAELNCEAAKRAASFAAFVPSTHYCQMALNLLQADDPNDSAQRIWNDHYPLALDLYSLLAETTLCSGQLELSQQATDLVMEHAKDSDDTLWAHQVHITILLHQDKFEESIDASIDLLVELGVDIPKKPSKFQMFRIKKRIQKKLSRLSDEQILALPATTDHRVGQAIKVLSDICVPTMQLGRFQIQTMALCKLVELTLKHGVAGFSAVGFSMIGLSFVADDVSLAYRFAKLSDVMVEMETTSNTSLSRACFLSPHIRHWREPFSKLVDEIHKGVNIGLKTGDVLYAFFCVIGYSVLYFYAGLPLQPLVMDLKNYCVLAEEYGQKNALLQILPLYQCILNITGDSEDIMDLSLGEAKRYRDKVDWNRKTGVESESSYAMQIAYFCGDMERAAALYSGLIKAEIGLFRGVFFHQARVFFFALIAMAQYKVTKQRSWKKEGTAHMKTIHDWAVHQKGINLTHKLMILKAEHSTLDGKTSTVKIKTNFDQAIAASARIGYFQDAALAALVASRSLTDPEDQTDYHRRAMEHLDTWGAHGLIAYLSEELDRLGKRPSYTRERSASLRNSSLRSRERYDDSVIKAHHHLDLSESGSAFNDSSNRLNDSGNKLDLFGSSSRRASDVS